LHRIAAYLAILPAGNWNTYGDYYNYSCSSNNHCYCDSYASSAGDCDRYGYIYHIYCDIYTYRSCNCDLNAHCCNEYARRFCNQYSYSHSNSHKHTNTLISI
jgi:hypothetical protein